MRSRRITAIVLILAVALTSACATLSLVESIESLLRQAKELLAAKRYDDALTKLTEIIRRDPTVWEAYLYSAQAYIGKTVWASALDNARKAFERAPTSLEVLATLGESLLGSGLDAVRRGAFAEAAGNFVEYIKLRPNDPRGYLEAGRAYIGLRSWGDAAKVLVQGVSLTGDAATRGEFIRALQEGGLEAMSRSDYRGAITLLKEQARLEPTNVSALLSLGKAYWGAGERVEALGAYSRVLELAPQNEEARRFLGR